MVNSITNFLAKATGPSKLRSTLYAKTRHISLILIDVNSIRAVQTEIPKGVLGGDIFALISGRIREQLQYSEQTGSIVDKVQTKSPGLTDRSNARTDSEKAKYTFGQSLTDRPTGASVPLKPKVQNQVQLFSIPSMTNEMTTNGKSDSQQISNIEQPLPGSDVIAYNVELPSVSKKDAITEGHITSGQTIMPIFVEKLREYWQLNQNEYIVEKSTNQQTSELIEGEKDTSSTTTLLSNTPASRPWPETIGQQLSHKLRPFVSGNKDSATSGNIQKSIQSELPEKVEIQNVFNIEVKPEGNRNTGSNIELSDKIADILREQALQHGIDIT